MVDGNSCEGRLGKVQTLRQVGCWRPNVGYSLLIVSFVLRVIRSVLINFMNMTIPNCIQLIEYAVRPGRGSVCECRLNIAVLSGLIDI